MNAVFIYSLNCPITGAVRYVGKSKNPFTRLIQHISESKKETNHRACWIRYLAEQGLRPLLEIVDEATSEHWQQLEVAYIEFFREQGCNLVNGTNGGEDPPLFSRRGMKCSPEARAKISAANKGNKYCLGRKLSSEARAKLRAANEGKKHSPEARAKMSAAKKGMKNGSR